MCSLLMSGYGTRRGYGGRNRRSARKRSRRNMRSTAISVLDGTSVYRASDNVTWPKSISGLPSDLSARISFFTADDAVNYRLPEFYAFRDGLYQRLYVAPSGGYFVPTPGPVLGKARPIDKLCETTEKDYARNYCGKVVSFLPGTLWNVHQTYAGIARGTGPSTRTGDSIRSLRGELDLFLRPAVLNAPFQNFPDADARALARSSSWTEVPEGFAQQTSYVMPTWAMIIVFSYRPAARDFFNCDNGTSDDLPAHCSNTLSWIRNRHSTKDNDRYGRMYDVPAEVHLDRVRHESPTLPSSVGFGGSAEPWDFNVPAPGKEPIRSPSDVEIDGTYVKVWRKRVVYFGNERCALRDTEGILNTAWATNRQLDWEYEATSGTTGSGTVVAGGRSDVAGVLGSAQPPSGGVVGGTSPGIMALDKNPNVSGRRVQMSFDFNGKELSFDDSEDDQDVQMAQVMGHAVGNTGATVEGNADAAIEAETKLEEEDDAGDGEGVPSDGNYQTIDFPAGGFVGSRVPVERWHDYSDNPANGNLYFTVVTPSYALPVRVGGSEPAETTAPLGFTIPTWGSVPVKLTASTKFRFKK